MKTAGNKKIKTAGKRNNKKEGESMAKQTGFNEAWKKHFKTLELYVPVVERVHGSHHPEFYEVRRLFDEIRREIEEAGSEGPELDKYFTKLREITNNYTVPDGVCETYEAVYSMLAEIDEACRAR